MGLIASVRAFFARADPADTEVSADLLRVMLGEDTITKEQAMSIPAFAGCVNMISNTISMIPIRLYERKDNEIKLTEDARNALLNEDTRDTLSGAEFKRAMVYDYLVSGNAYAYVNRRRARAASIHYVKAEDVTLLYDSDPIFKRYEICVNGRLYGDWEFVKLLRNSRNGWSGKSIVEESNEVLHAAHASIVLQKNLAAAGGNKKGFLQATKRLTKEALEALKEGWRNLYKARGNDMLVLNEGTKFAEVSSSSTEMQLNESIETMNEGICKLFGMPTGMLGKNPTESDREQFIQYCIMPILTEMECALNRDLLQEREKGKLFFAADVSELTKGDIVKRYTAYGRALKDGWMQIDEVRFKEKYQPLGLPYIKLGLQDVWYDSKTGIFYNPNMNQTGSFDMPQTTQDQTAQKQTQEETKHES